jgi:hypothetical protein
MSKKELLSALEDLCRNRSSGMLIAVTEENHHVRIGLQKGEIVHLATHRLHGGAAVQVVVTSSYRSFNFTPGSELQVQQDVPATELFVNALRNGKFDESEADFSVTPEPSGIAAGTLRVIGEELAEYLGPIAPVLVGELKNEPSVKAVLQKLLKELPTPAAKEAFVGRVKSRLKAG